MTFYKFDSEDVLYNQIKTNPNVNFKIYDRNIYLNNQSRVSGSFVSNIGGIPTGYIDLYENNIDRPAGQLIYPFITKEGTFGSFKTISTNDFNSGFTYGDKITGSYPAKAGISIDSFSQDQTRLYIQSLRNILDRNRLYSSHYAYSSSLGNKGTQPLKLISIPSIFYGSSVQKGSVSCKFFVSGTMIAELLDSNGNGELKQSYPKDSNSGSVAGVILYNEGFIILTGSWSLHATHTECYNPSDPYTYVSPKWIHFGTTGSATNTDPSGVPYTSFELDFNGINYVPVITMLTRAPKGELNFSNNPTFVQYGINAKPITGSYVFQESEYNKIKNISKSPFSDSTGSFEQTVFISKVAIYDKDKNLIGIAKLAQPVRKRVNDEFTFKIKMDI